MRRGVGAALVNAHEQHFSGAQSALVAHFSNACAHSGGFAVHTVAPAGGPAIAAAAFVACYAAFSSSVFC